MSNFKTFTQIEIKIGDISLNGNLRLHENSKGIIVFSHGSGSSRLSVRNNYVADLLYRQNYSSLLFDLLTEKEDLKYENRFNIDLLSDRLIKVTNWIKNYSKTNEMLIGYFGSSTGAASALKAAVQLNTKIKAVVSRGGRPDMVIPVLDKLRVPTLLIVGGNDHAVIELNEKAKEVISSICELKIVPGASHLFSEFGKLEIVANLTIEWFDKYLKKT